MKIVWQKRYMHTREDWYDKTANKLDRVIDKVRKKPGMRNREAEEESLTPDWPSSIDSLCSPRREIFLC